LFNVVFIQGVSMIKVFIVERLIEFFLFFVFDFCFRCGYMMIKLWIDLAI